MPVAGSHCSLNAVEVAGVRVTAVPLTVAVSWVVQSLAQVFWLQALAPGQSVRVRRATVGGRERRGLAGWKHGAQGKDVSRGRCVLGGDGGCLQGAFCPQASHSW